MNRHPLPVLRRRLKRLAKQRDDAELLRTRDRLIRLYDGPAEGEFWSYIEMFDENAAKRRRDGSLRSYVQARNLLDDAALALERAAQEVA